MTADERIEKLLNRFGQTISDLPTTYHPSHRCSARCAAFDWIEKNKPELLETPFLIIGMLSTYVCHLADIIDRMEIALETAVKCAPCHTCANIKYCDGSSCDDFRIEDEYLSDVSEKDAKRYIDAD